MYYCPSLNNPTIIIPSFSDYPGTLGGLLVRFNSVGVSGPLQIVEECNGGRPTKNESAGPSPT